MRRIDIICAAYQAEAFIDETIGSALAQTHRDWRLWVRDDASTDGTANRIAEWAARDPRIVLSHRGSPNLGVVAGFAWLLDRLPIDSEWVACLDADDVWAPNRLAATLAAAEQAVASGARGRPLLVHSDCRLIDAAGAELAPSYWRRAGLSPTPMMLRRIAVQNVATSSTMLMNRALLDRIRPMPTTGIISPDWWFTMVAAAFGDIVAIPVPLVSYRQHGGNEVGATQGQLRSFGDLVGRLDRWRASQTRIRLGLVRLARQAETFRSRYGAQLPHTDLHLLDELVTLPTLSRWARKRAILRTRVRAEHGILRNLGLLIRG